MDYDSAQGHGQRKDDIRNHCHINTNEDGDRFVGIRIDTDHAMVYFPIGYQLPETDAGIRMDIRHLIQVLSEFTTREERLVAVRKSAVSETVDFPLHAYQEVLEYYFSIGGNYYVETDPVYKTGVSGKQDWSRTIRNQVPFVQQKDGVSSLIYTTFTIRTVTPNAAKQITQINRFCVYEAFRKLGWLYVPYMPEQPGPHPDLTTSIAVLNSKLCNTNDDKKRNLFQAMKDMLQFMDEKTSEKRFFFGTDQFEHVWEKLIDRAFGERNKEQYFPKTRWLLDYGTYKEKRPLMPDTIMIYDGRYYVLDAKYYRYGWTADPDHLPNASSINKQITYGEYMEHHFHMENDSLFNAFLMPYNMAENRFGLTGTVGNIGEAVGEWRSNKKNYERIQGIVIDTRYLMYHYTGNPKKEKIALADCIRAVLGRGVDKIESDAIIKKDKLTR